MDFYNFAKIAIYSALMFHFSLSLRAFHTPFSSTTFCFCLFLYSQPPQPHNFNHTRCSNFCFFLFIAIPFQVPYNVAFKNKTSEDVSLLVVDSIVDVIFFIDIGEYLSMFCAYQHHQLGWGGLMLLLFVIRRERYMKVFRRESSKQNMFDRLSCINN